MEKIYIDHFLSAEDGSLEVGYHVNDELPGAHSRRFSSYTTMIGDSQSPFSTNEAMLQMALSSWIGVDPTGGDQSLATEFRLEVDMGAIVPVRRVLDV